MAFYPQFSGFYAHPMYFPNQEFYAMYHPNAMESNQMFYQDSNNNGNNMHFKFNKPGYNNRKISQDSGISDFSSGASRKVSNISSVSIAEETSADDDVKEPEAPLEIPSDEICEEIVEQVEFYFSNANITKDKFLLKHVKRNKEGFVSLKLISSFKRVKHLCKDWRQVAYAVEKKSQKLEVNDLKTKVRRLEPLPEYDETTPSRTVVVLNLPMERPTIEGVAEMFKVCGDIVLVRILRPGNPIPADVRPFVNKHPEMAGKVCALVEFEKTEFAMKAVREKNCEEEEKMKVMELTAPPPAKTSKKNEEKKKMMMMAANKQQQHQAPMSSGMQQPPQRRYSQGMMPAQMMMASEGAPPRRKVSLMHNMKFSAMSAEQPQKAGGLNPNAPIFTMQQRRLSRPSQPSAPAFMMEPAFGMMHPMQPFPGWMTRRISGQMEYAASGLALNPNVMRQPRGPSDKGKGFQKWCRTRMEPRKPGSRAVPIVAPPPAQSPSIAKEESKKDEKKEEMAEAGGAVALPEISVNPVIIIQEDSESSDEGHFSDTPLENEKSR